MSNNFRTIMTFIFFVVGIAIISITLVLVVEERKRASLIQDEIYALEQEKKQYEHDNKELQGRVAYLQSEHSYEKEAKKLNYKKPGERVIIVRRSSKKNETKPHTKSEPKQVRKEHYQIWLEQFF